MASENLGQPDVGMGGTVNISRVLLLTVAFIALSVIHLARLENDLVTHIYFLQQDVWVIIATCLLFVALALRIPALSLPQRMPLERWVWTVAVLLALALWAGTYLIMFDYPLTRDEHMVVFDQAVYSSLDLSRSLPAQWDGYAEALVPAFLLDTPGHQLLVSSYAPGNAMARAAFGWIADPALMNPALAALGFAMLYRIARKLFPETPEAVWVVLLAFLLSVQVWVNAMTTYAMTGHLALNLVWLALFLRGTRLSHAGAMAVGFVTIGWHQLVFHPLFAAPFILALLRDKRFGLFFAYSAFYAASLLFWIGYPHIVTSLAGVAVQSGSTAGGLGYLTERVLPRLIERDPFTFGLMQYNLLRFFGWQALFALPLLVIAAVPVWRGEGIARPLAAGFLLTVAAMMLVIPYQGHGWGYRYLHGLIGNVALLAGYGYRYWARSAKSQANGLTVVLGAATLVSIPFLLAMTYFFVKPYALLGNVVGRQTADFVVVDTFRPSSAIDQVRNLPDLSNRPLIFSAKHLDSARLDQLCRRGTVALIRRKQFHSVGFVMRQPEFSPSFEPFVAPLANRPCLRPTVP
jgi:hypothetical protein